MTPSTSGRPEPEILLEGGRLLNVFNGALERTNVLIGGGTILGVGPSYSAAPIVYHLDGAIILPGLIDGHIHIESSFLTPARFTEAAVTHGTSTNVADPHEIANVLGVEGIRWMLRASAGLALDILLMAPSCVPPSSLETAGARLGAAQVVEMLHWDGILGLAEVMDMASVLAGDPDMMGKLNAARRGSRAVDGHAPRLSGPALNAYLAAGIESDHECVDAEEAREKLGLGMRIMIREGSQARNLRDLVSIIDATTVRRCLLVSDDRDALALVERGHVDHLLRRAVAVGVPPLWAVQMVTLNAAEHFGLRGRGAVAPGWHADLVVVEDLSNFCCQMVFKAGRLVAERGKFLGATLPSPPLRPTMNVAPITREALRIPARGGLARVIELVPGQIETRETFALPRICEGEVVADPDRDLAKLVVIERHHRTGHVGRGLVRGFNLRRGALAGSVAHDSHHLIAVGVDDRDLLAALSEVVAHEGGLAVADGEARTFLPLPVAGLMSDAPVEETVRGLASVQTAARAVGVSMDRPFGALSFLALPVVPALRLTDLGLVDATRGRLVSLSAEASVT